MRFAIAATVGLMLLWTNPPDLDLAYITLHAVRLDAPAETLRFVHWGRFDEFDPPPVIPGPGPLYLRPGMPESLSVSLPCRSVPVPWRFWITATDTTGRNTSLPSNAVEWSDWTP